MITSKKWTTVVIARIIKKREYNIRACSTETAKRTTFETLQNLRQQECQKNGDADCQKRESYDEYQRMKQEEKKTQE